MRKRTRLQEVTAYSSIIRRRGPAAVGIDMDGINPARSVTTISSSGRRPDQLPLSLAQRRRRLIGVGISNATSASVIASCSGEHQQLIDATRQTTVEWL